MATNARFDSTRAKALVDSGDAVTHRAAKVPGCRSRATEIGFDFLIAEHVGPATLMAMHVGPMVPWAKNETAS